MKIYRFTIKEHEEYGTIGLAPAWYPNGDPLDGMGAAHDILEHFPNDDGSTEGELQALGASIFIRGDGNWFNGYRHYDELRDPAGDFPQIIRLHFDRNASAIKTAPHCNDKDLSARMFAVMMSARKLVRDENRDGGDDFTKQEWRNVAGWMTQGYRRAERRYREHSAYDVAALFDTIATRLNDALKENEHFEGAEIKVRVNFKTLTAQVITEF